MASLREAARGFLASNRTSNGFELFTSYANDLLRLSDSLHIPVDLGRIRSTYGLRTREAPLDARGLMLGDCIVVNSDDSHSVQRFSKAHEIMESLFLALQAEEQCRFPREAETRSWPEKERWCERGAAELLMPSELFYPLVSRLGVSLQSAQVLSRSCQSSLTATVRRMLASGMSRCVFVLLKQGHKKSQVVPSKSGQMPLWGNPEDWDPPAELRVWRKWSSPHDCPFVCPNESISHQTSIYQTLESGVPGQIYEGLDDLDMEYIKGPHDTESLLVRIDGEVVIMALVHL